MFFSILSGLLGGLGLFLIGMRLMTQGLRNAAGPALRDILANWTKTPLRGLISGFTITALVQSSSAVTVAAIGFVNAGLMNLRQSVGVIFGSNIGTTVTGWIVTAVGVSVNVKALALPMIGLGAILRLTGGQSRRTHFGDAITGFGIFFLGIEVLQTAFTALETTIDLSAFTFGGMTDIVVFTGIGFMLTLLMQSSSAAMALVLTAAMSGVVSFESAAAAVIGTNIGTTSTAMLSTIGATSNAKKVAGAHAIFNLGTACVALFLIPAFHWLSIQLNGADDPTSMGTSLALFHTAFNVLGVILFLPLTDRLVSFLNHRIGRAEAKLGRPQFIGPSTLKTPLLAMDALFMELGHLGEMTRLTAQKGLASHFRHKDFIRDRSAFDTLVRAIRKYCVQLQKLDLPESVAERLPKALRVIQYYRKTVNIIDEMSQEFALLDHTLPAPAAETASLFRSEVKDILNVAHTPCSEEFDSLQRRAHELLDLYHEVKEELLRLGADGQLELSRMVALLDYYSHIRMLCQQAAKGTVTWADLRNRDVTCAMADENNQYAWKPEQ